MQCCGSYSLQPVGSMSEADFENLHMGKVYTRCTGNKFCSKSEGLNFLTKKHNTFIWRPRKSWTITALRSRYFLAFELKCFNRFQLHYLFLQFINEICDPYNLLNVLASTRYRSFYRCSPLRRRARCRQFSWWSRSRWRGARGGWRAARWICSRPGTSPPSVGLQQSCCTQTSRQLVNGPFLVGTERFKPCRLRLWAQEFFWQLY